MRISLQERVNHRASIQLELWSGYIPDTGLRRYIWDRIWRRVHGPFVRISATGKTKVFR